MVREYFIFGKDKLTEGTTPETRIDIGVRTNAHRKPD